MCAAEPQGCTSGVSREGPLTRGEKSRNEGSDVEERGDDTPLLLEQDVEGAASGRRAHELEADGARRERGHELDVGLCALLPQADDEDRRLEREGRRKIGDRQCRRRDRRPRFDDVVGADDHVARHPTLGDADAPRLVSANQIDGRAVTRELHGGHHTRRIRPVAARGPHGSICAAEELADLQWNRIKSRPPSSRSKSAALRCGGIFDYDAKRERLEEVNRELENPAVWSDQERAQNLGRERAELEAVVATLNRVAKSLDEAGELHELAREEQDSSTLADVVGQVEGVTKQLEVLEFRRMFAGKMDSHNAFLDVQAGQGGTEAQDWAAMLFRMYLKWAERHGFTVDVLEESAGEVAGIKSATIHVRGEYAFGWLRTETGVHRLVRKSPFDSGHRRHTSFAAVFVSPEIEDDIEIELNPADLRVDVFRSSGAGGQHVNKTESAIRITHLPTGIVVQCQNERSQHKNRATAMNQMRAKLYELEEQKRKEQAQLVEDNKADIGWGNQIRSYVLDQSRVKDLRTNHESGQPQHVLDGDLDDFLQESLKQGL